MSDVSSAPTILEHSPYNLTYKVIWLSHGLDRSLYDLFILMDSQAENKLGECAEGAGMIAY